MKVGLVHDLGVRILGLWELHGAPEHKEDVLRLVESMVGWSVGDLRLKRVGSAVERVVMGVVDGRLDRQEEHSVFPAVLRPAGSVEEAGRWLESSA